EKLGLDPEIDRQSAQILNNLLTGRAVSRSYLSQFFGGKLFAAVFGAGPSLVNDLDEFLDVFDFSDAVVVAADGAVDAFLEKGVKPHVVVTDLDGGDDVLLKADELNVVFVVHAHGDNIEKVLGLVPRIRSRVLGTTQVEPFGVLDNFGGFTDGDRAVFMCEELGMRNIVVAGMDFDGDVGKHSKPKPLTDEERKRKKHKLQIGKTLLETLASFTAAKLYDASNNNSRIKGFEKTSWKRLKNILGGCAPTGLERV
ncbi:MAG: DUF115 domain-containing protein, partial [Nitrososphaerota archaeon]|nr:DUF115 domain-containing protein [Nitrososphaerota archaeon]